MKKQFKNEQAESNSDHANSNDHAAFSVSKNKIDDEKGSEFHRSSTYKLKAYHPKMMIAYKAYALSLN